MAGLAKWPPKPCSFVMSPAPAKGKGNPVGSAGRPAGLGAGRAGKTNWKHVKLLEPRWARAIVQTRGGLNYCAMF